MTISSPLDLFYYDLCAMYDAEQKLVQMLPQLAQESLDPQAREAFTQHEQETRQHVRNLEQCFQILRSQPATLENQTVTGLKRDHDTFLQQNPPREALTMFDLNAGYKSELIEMAAYHSLIDEATNIGLQQCVQLFQQNLQQEQAAAQKLATIAHQLGQQQVQGSQPQAPNQSYAAPAPPVQGQTYGTAGSQTDRPYAAPGPQPVQSFGTPNPQPSQSSGGTSPQAAGSSQVKAGMEVVGSDMNRLGQVSDVRDNDFLLDRPLRRDVYVPYSAIQNVDASRVTLNVSSDQVENMNWPNPPLTSA